MAITVDESREIQNFESRLQRFAEVNNKKNKYYYQENRVKDLGVNTPKFMQNLDVVVGWPAASVDIQLERINCLGFYSPNEDDSNVQWLNSLWKQNYFESDQKNHQKDSMITGVSFISIAPGNVEKGEPEVLWMSENSSNITVDYDPRTRRVTRAFKRVKGPKKSFLGVLWTPNETIEMIKKENQSQWEEVSRDVHNLGFVPVVPVFNSADSMFPYGKTEITKTIRSYTDIAMRIILSSEVMREYYARPVRAIIGGNPSDFDNLIVHEGKLVWKLASGDIINIPTSYGKDGKEIDQRFEEFGSEDPTNVLKMIEFYGRLVAREIGVPPSYMGFDTINPSSADAINAADSKLIQRANQRIPQLKRTYKQLAEFSLKVAGREIGEGFANTEANFARTDTITPQAAADRVSKLNAVGIFDKEMPEWVYRELNLNDVEIQQTKNFISAKSAANLISQLSQGITVAETAVE